MAHPKNLNPQSSPSEARLNIRPKTRQFIDKLTSDPKINATDAWIATHKTNNRMTAKANANKVLRKPSVRAYMKKHVKEAKTTVYTVMKDAKEYSSPAYQRLALDAANSIIDRVEGKPTTKIETKNENLNVNVEVSAELGAKFAEFLTQSTEVTSY